MPVSGKTAQQAGFEALIRVLRKTGSGELKRWRFGVLFAMSSAGHAGAERGCDAGHLEPFLFLSFPSPSTG